MRKTAKPHRPAAHELTVSRAQLLLRGDDHAFRQFVHDTLAFSARIQAIRNALGGVIGLSGPQYTILIAIARDQDKKLIGINYIAERLHYSPAFVTIEVGKLVAARLITKKAHPKDKRRVLLSITAKARDLLQQLTIVQRPVNDMLFESLTMDDFERLRHKMPALVDSADRALELLSFLSRRKGTAAAAPGRARSTA